MQGLHVGLNLAVAIALHNIPEVQNSTIQLLSLYDRFSKI
jgi:zinc transporter ZupT